MDTIIEIEDRDLRSLLAELTERKLHSPPYKLRVCIEGDSAQFKINESTWSPPLGHLDPMCREAQRRRSES